MEFHASLGRVVPSLLTLGAAQNSLGARGSALSCGTGCRVDENLDSSRATLAWES